MNLSTLILILFGVVLVACTSIAFHIFYLWWAWGLTPSSWSAVILGAILLFLFNGFGVNLIKGAIKLLEEVM